MNDLEPIGIHLKADVCRPDGFFLNSRFIRYAVPFRTIPNPTISVRRSQESGRLVICWEAHGVRVDAPDGTIERGSIPDDPAGWWRPPPGG